MPQALLLTHTLRSSLPSDVTILPHIVSTKPHALPSTSHALPSTPHALPSTSHALLSSPAAELLGELHQTARFIQQSLTSEFQAADAIVDETRKASNPVSVRLDSVRRGVRVSAPLYETFKTKLLELETRMDQAYVLCSTRIKP